MEATERAVKMDSAFAPLPNYRISIEPAGRRIRVVFGGETIADSDRVLELNETRHAATYYFPKADVRTEFLTPTAHTTHCPFKGNARYWTISIGGREIENAVWSYDEPYAEAEEVAGHLSFYLDKMDAWFEGDDAAPGSAVLADHGIAANPLVDWVLREAWDATTSRELVRRLAEQLNDIGYALIHLNVVVPTLHPLLVANAYRWTKKTGEVRRHDASQETILSDAFQSSPLRPVFDSGRGVRCKISDPASQEYPIFSQLREEGGTDYTAIPMRFSDGQINAVTMATDKAGGFTTEELGHVHEVLPTLSRLFEVHAKARTARTLFKTFMGEHTGEKVLNGQVKRGDGEDIHAVIWFSDLRDSTPLADSMARDDYLEYLNTYFDSMAGAVVDNGGEILRFIGDAALAIFPIDGSGDSDRKACCNSRTACTRALDAANEARRRIDEANERITAKGWQPIRFGIGLHVGDVTYGNIGIPERLEFTVIGAAANEAARIESLSKETGETIVLSSDFARKCGEPLRSLGCFPLRGVGTEREIFTLVS